MTYDAREHPLIGHCGGVGPSVVIMQRSASCPAWCDGSWHAAWGESTWHSSAQVVDGGDQASWVMWINQSDPRIGDGPAHPFITLHLTAEDCAHESAVVMLSAAAAATLAGQLIALAEQAQA